MVIIRKVMSFDGEDWETGSYEDIVKKYHHRHVKDYPPIHPVDILAMATREDPIPVKNLNGRFEDSLGGKYMGTHVMVDGLQRDKFTCMFGSHKLRLSRWMMLKVDQEKSSTALDEDMQHFETHGTATIQVGSLSYVPSEDFDAKTPIIAV